MSQSRPNATYADFEASLQSFERVLNDAIQSAIKKNELTDEQQMKAVDVNAGVDLYLNTKIPGNQALSLALQAWNVVARVKGLFDQLSKKENASKITLNVAYAIKQAGVEILEEIKKVNVLSENEKNILKGLTEGAKVLSSFFFDETVDEHRKENVELIINHFINSPAIQNKWAIERATLSHYLGGVKNTTLPEFIKELDNALKALAKIANPANVNQVAAAPQIVQIADQQADDQSIDDVVQHLMKQQNEIKKKMRAKEISLVDIENHEAENKNIKKEIDNARNRYMDEMKDNKQVAQQLKKDNLEAKKIEASAIQKYLIDFTQKYNEILKEYPTWRSYYVDYGYRGLNQHLNQVLELTKLRHMLKVETPSDIWNWSPLTQKAWEEYFANQLARINQEIKSFDDELQKLNNIVNPENGIEEKDAVMIGYINTLSKDNKAVADNIEDVKQYVFGKKRRDKIETAKSDLDEYLRKRNKKYVVKDFFEVSYESVSSAFGGNYKSEKTVRKEFVTELKGALDAVGNEPTEDNTKALTDAINTGLTQFKPRLGSKGINTPQKKSSSLKGYLNGINEELKEVVKTDNKPQ